MVESELFQGFGFWHFFAECTISGLVIFFSERGDCIRDWYENSEVFPIMASGVGIMFSVCLNEPGILGCTSLLAASWFGWWLLIGIGAVVAAVRDRRSEG